MKIIVFDVPADSGGALSILEEYYHKAINYPDKNVQWVFVLSKANFKETNKVKILRYPWVKKSWWHRLFFDYFIAPRLVKKHKPDKILSLQNTIIPRTNKIEQILYIHQSLPFVEYKFKLRENIRYWVYQNIIGRMIVKSIEKADCVIVQTNWMKKACIKKAHVEINKILVEPPKINVEVRNHFESKKANLKTFFYPAHGASYKNHKIIIEACEKLKDKGINDYKLIFTLQGDEYPHISKLYKKVLEKGLPINFIGKIDRETVFDYYKKSVLIFPSYIETFGLPLLEAKLHKSPIIACDMAFAHEILEDYDKVLFFDPFNSEELYESMLKILTLEEKNLDKKVSKYPDSPL